MDILGRDSPLVKGLPSTETWEPPQPPVTDKSSARTSASIESQPRENESSAGSTSRQKRSLTRNLNNEMAEETRKN